MQLAPRLPALQLALMRKGTPPRNACVHCYRTPLVGELVHRYEGGMVCDLCRPRLRSEPQHSELMHPPEGERCVRVYRNR